MSILGIRKEPMKMAEPKQEIPTPPAAAFQQDASTSILTEAQKKEARRAKAKESKRKHDEFKSMFGGRLDQQTPEERLKFFAKDIKRAYLLNIPFEDVKANCAKLRPPLEITPEQYEKIGKKKK